MTTKEIEKGHLGFGRTYGGTTYQEPSWYVEDFRGAVVAGGAGDAGETARAARHDAAVRGIRLVAECIYCNNDVPDVGRAMAPDVDDDRAWALLSPDHHPDCEWVLTRAHRLPYPEDEQITGATPLDDR